MSWKVEQFQFFKLNEVKYNLGYVLKTKEIAPAGFRVTF